ncbi:MAG TPA: hypothetical protein PKK60_02905 [archaeon]|nr:hypothetical protein [archaeon]
MWITWNVKTGETSRLVDTGCPGIRSNSSTHREFGYNSSITNVTANWGDRVATRAEFHLDDRTIDEHVYKKFGIRTPDGYHWMMIDQGYWELVKDP